MENLVVAGITKLSDDQIREILADTMPVGTDYDMKFSIDRTGKVVKWCIETRE